MWWRSSRGVAELAVNFGLGIGEVSTRFAETLDRQGKFGVPARRQRAGSSRAVIRSVSSRAIVMSTTRLKSEAIEASADLRATSSCTNGVMSMLRVAAEIEVSAAVGA